MSIKTWPKQERPREKLLEKGSASLSDAELLAIFLRTGTKGKTAVDLARELLNHFGSLHTLFQAPHQELCNINGLGATKTLLFQAILEICRRYLKEELQNHSFLENSQSVKHYLITQIGGIKHEVFGCLFLDKKYRLICFQELFQGGIDHIHIYPQEVAKKALLLNASSVILTHNHPSGEIAPTMHDKKLTQSIGEILKIIDIQLLDHIIVTRNQAFSFAEQGLTTN